VAKADNNAPSRKPAGSIVRRLTREPSAPGARDEFLNDRDVDRVHAGHAEADEEPADHQIDPGVLGGQRHRSSGDRGVQHRADHRFAPTDLVGRPAPEQRAEGRADAGGEQDHPRLPEGQVPVLDDERQNKDDQPKVEEIEHVADRSS
jgi:hypothetical protein